MDTLVIQETAQLPPSVSASATEPDGKSTRKDQREARRKKLVAQWRSTDDKVEKERVFKDLLQLDEGLIRQSSWIMWRLVRVNKRAHPSWEVCVCEAQLAYFRALATFDESKNTKLSTWFIHHMRHAVSLFCRQYRYSDSGVKFAPTHLRRASSVVIRKLCNRNDDAEDDSLINTLEGVGVSKLLQLAVDRVFITESQRQIIVRRFGIGGVEPETLQSIANELGVTKERVRQKEAKALNQLYQFITSYIVEQERSRG